MSECAFLRITSELAQGGQLWVLNASNLTRVTDVSFLPSIKSLRELEADGNRLSSYGVLWTLPFLKRLHMNQNPYLESTLFLKGCKHLQTLSLDMCMHLDPAIFAELLPLFLGLYELYLCNFFEKGCN